MLIGLLKTFARYISAGKLTVEIKPDEKVKYGTWRDELVYGPTLRSRTRSSLTP